MSHFYAGIPGSARKTEPTARGHKTTGIETYAAGWGGRVTTYVWYDHRTGKDMFEVHMEPHKGAGDSKLLAKGEVGKADTVAYDIGDIH